MNAPKVMVLLRVDMIPLVERIIFRRTPLPLTDLPFSTVIDIQWVLQVEDDSTRIAGDPLMPLSAKMLDASKVTDCDPVVGIFELIALTTPP